MSPRRSCSRLMAGSIAMALTASLLAAGASVPAAAQDGQSEPFEGMTPKALKGIPLVWFEDPLESSSPGSTLPRSADISAVGMHIGQGPDKVRNQTIKKRTQPGNAVANEADQAKGEQLLYVVFNLAGNIPNKTKTDLVAFVGGTGADAVPWDVATRGSLTEGASFVHLIGKYGSLQGAPWRTADADTSGDAPGTQIALGEIPSSGVGGYDKKTKSIWTTIILPEDVERMTFGVFSTDGGFQTDLLDGLGHTNTVPVPPVANGLECAKVDVYGLTDADGDPTGLTDIKVTLVEPVDGISIAPAAQHVLAFHSDGAPVGDPPVEAFPESPPGSGTTYWQASVPSGAIDINAPTASGWGLPSDLPGPTVADAFEGVRVNGLNVAGTAFGHPDCGKFFVFEGCTHGGGADFWNGLVVIAGTPGAPGTDAVVTEVPFPFDNGWNYCVVVDQDVPLMAFGISPTPYTLAGHEHALASSHCDRQAVEVGLGGVALACPDGSTVFSWLMIPNGVAGDTGDVWGFRFEGTVTPQGMHALGLESGSVPPPDLAPYMQAAAEALLDEAGWVRGDDGLRTFAAGPIALD